MNPLTGQMIGPSCLESMRPRQHHRHTFEATRTASLRRCQSRRLHYIRLVEPLQLIKLIERDKTSHACIHRKTDRISHTHTSQAATCLPATAKPLSVVTPWQMADGRWRTSA